MQIRDMIKASDPVHWGVLSTANIGVKAVAPAIMASSNSKLVAVASRDARKVADLYDFVPGIQVYGDYESLIHDPDVEAVYVPLPNSLHAEWSIKALEAGKHVLCEKPLATTSEEGAEMFEAAHTHHVILMEAGMYRFHPQTQWVLEQVRNGAIGAVKLVRSSFAFDVRSRPTSVHLSAELAGGALIGMGYYPLNLCRAIFGSAPLSVVARVHVARPGGVDLTSNAILDFGAGRFGLLDASLVLPTRQIAEIIGDSGTITVPVPFTPGTMEAIVFVTENGQMHEQKFERVDQYQLEVEHFARCIRSGQEPALRMNETLENLATIEAIYQAAGHDWPIV
jgi:predicted dehydrogenase